jgi:hypothetical protein
MAHMLCSDNPLSQFSLEKSPVLFPMIGKELKCDLVDVSCFFSWYFFVGFYFHKQRVLAVNTFDYFSFY